MAWPTNSTYVDPSAKKVDSPFNRNVKIFGDLDYSNAQQAVDLDLVNTGLREMRNQQWESDDRNRRNAKEDFLWQRPYQLQDREYEKQKWLDYMGGLFGGVGGVAKAFTTPQATSLLSGLLGDAMPGQNLQFRNNSGQPIGGVSNVARPTSSMYGYAS